MPIFTRTYTGAFAKSTSIFLCILGLFKLSYSLLSNEVSCDFILLLFVNRAKNKKYLKLILIKTLYTWNIKTKEKILRHTFEKHKQM